MTAGPKYDPRDRSRFLNVAFDSYRARTTFLLFHYSLALSLLSCSPLSKPSSHSYEFLWAEDEYKNNPSSLPACVYIEKVKVWAEKQLAVYKTFTPDGKTEIAILL